MSTPPLHAPWRMEYIRSLEKPDGDACFLCLAASAASDDERRRRLVLWTTDHTVVVMNKYPYTNGHLLVAPRVHGGDLDSLSIDALNDLTQQTVKAITLLKRTCSPQGFNVGINLGRPAGAGLPGHLHQHVVPRWNGDVNFMSVVGEVRIVPQALEQLYEELQQQITELRIETAG